VPTGPLPTTEAVDRAHCPKVVVPATLTANHWQFVPSAWHAVQVVSWHGAHAPVCAVYSVVSTIPELARSHFGLYREAKKGVAGTYQEQTVSFLLSASQKVQFVCPAQMFPEQYSALVFAYKNPGEASAHFPSPASVYQPQEVWFSFAVQAEQLVKTEHRGQAETLL